MGRVLSLKMLCLKNGIDPARGRERAIKAGIPLEMIRTPGADGRVYEMLCVPTEYKQSTLAAIALKRGPYKKKI